MTASNPQDPGTSAITSPSAHDTARPSPGALERLDALRASLREFRSVCIGYSGGVDSVFVAAVALETLGPAHVLAVTGISDAVAAEQRSQARTCAATLGIPHLEIDTGEVDDPQYAANPSNRCYHCKTELWAVLSAVATARGLDVVIDGANADDAHDYRPGARAAHEHGVRSPMLEAGLTKADIRALSRVRGLPTWDLPASPCLASRLPYGVAVTRERLAQVEAGEDWLRRAGFREFRVRHHGDVARVEVAPVEMPRALALREQIAAALRTVGFAGIVLDLEGYRRGALNETLAPVPIGTRRAQDGATLATAGATVRAAGHQSEIACLSAAPERFSHLAGLIPDLRASGFRYVALDLTPPTAESDVPERPGAAAAGGR